MKEIWRASGLLNTLRFWSVVLFERRGTPHPFLQTFSYVSLSIWLFLSCILYNKLVIISGVLFWGLRVRIADYPTQGGGHGILRFILIASESKVPEIQTCDWHLTWEAVFWGSALNQVWWEWGILLPQESFRSELWNTKLVVSQELENCLA